MKKISESAVRRLSLYLRLLRVAAGKQELISSQELAERSGATSAQVRKDLSLFGSFGQRGRGYEVHGGKVGAKLGGLEVSRIDSLERVVREREVEIGIITTPPEAAPDVADRLTRAGVSAILNFAPVKIGGNEGTVVRTMDLALELEGLTFALTSSRGAERSPA